MKKPKRLTEDELQAVCAKRVNQKITEVKKLPSGNWEVISQAIDDFADKVGVDPLDVKIGNHYYNTGSYMKATRLETDEEKYKRIKADENDKYRYKKSQYDYWYKQEQYKVEQAQRTLQQSKIVQKSVVCCNRCGCTCCK